MRNAILSSVIIYAFIDALLIPQITSPLTIPSSLILMIIVAQFTNTSKNEYIHTVILLTISIFN